MKEKDYQRAYLRAPLRGEVLYKYRDNVFKTESLNISEGGLLLSGKGEPPRGIELNFLIYLPGTPILKNLETKKLLDFDPELFKGQCVRFTGIPVRSSSYINRELIGCKIIAVEPREKQLIADYVKRFSTNLICLQVQIDLVNSDPERIIHVRKLSEILGYEKNLKLSILRQKVESDYLSLQWL